MGTNAGLVGQAGGGKSSLIKRVSSQDQAAVDSLSQAHSQGVHTTTTSRLYQMSGFNIIDSPGIREFGLGHVSQKQLFHGFRELRPFAGSCKFRDCSHGAEAGCALKAAVDAGHVTAERLASYFEISKSIKNGAR